MVIALPVREDRGLQSELDPRFGRAPGFIIFDSETAKISYVENRQNYEAAQGAGIQSARNIIEAGAGMVISGLCGPNAYKVLSAAKIDLFYKKGGTVNEALIELEEDGLKRADDANIEGHWV